MALVSCCFLTAAHADLGAEFGVGRTDNIDRVESGGRSEELVTAAVGGEAESRGVSEGRVRWMVGAIDYREDTYEDEALAFVDGRARFDLFKRRLFWGMSDQLGQQSVDPFTPTTADTREYVNFFSMGPELLAPITDAMAFNAALNFSDVWYENQSTGNSRTGTQLGLTFGPRPVQSFGLFVNVSQVSFDEQDLYDDYDRRQIYLEYRTQRRRGTLRTAIGRSEIHGLGELRDSPMIEGTWTRELAAASDFSFEFRRGFSDAGELFQFSQTGQFAQIGGGSIGVVENVVTTAAPIELTYASLRLGIGKPRTSASISYSWSREQHEGAAQEIDRDVPTWNAQLSREVTSRLRFQVDAGATTDNFENADRQDSENRLGVGLGWAMSRRSALNVRLVHVERTSTGTQAGLSYEERRLFVTFAYGAQVAAISSTISSGL